VLRWPVAPVFLHLARPASAVGKLRQVAYTSQFLDRDNRAHRGKAKIKSCLIANLDPDEWEFPPKPKWMRWHTYNCHEEKFDAYEAILDEGCIDLMAKLLGENRF
jgi:hypothetical protein